MTTTRPSPGVCLGCGNTDPTTIIREDYTARPPLCHDCYRASIQSDIEEAERKAGWDASP